MTVTEQHVIRVLTAGGYIRPPDGPRVSYDLCNVRGGIERSLRETTVRKLRDVGILDSQLALRPAKAEA